MSLQEEYNKLDKKYSELEENIENNNLLMSDLLKNELKILNSNNNTISESLKKLKDEQTIIENDNKILDTNIQTRARMIEVMQQNNIYKQKVIYCFISLIFFLFILIVFFCFIYKFIFVFFTRKN